MTSPETGRTAFAFKPLRKGASVGRGDAVGVVLGEARWGGVDFRRGRGRLHVFFSVQLIGIQSGSGDDGDHGTERDEISIIYQGFFRALDFGLQLLKRKNPSSSLGKGWDKSIKNMRRQRFDASHF